MLTCASLQGIAFPAVHAIISAAVPKGYQSTAVAIVTAASYAGVAVAAGAAPWIIAEYSWPYVFYAFGLSAIVWLPFWLQATVPANPNNRATASLPAPTDADAEPLVPMDRAPLPAPTQSLPSTTADASSARGDEQALLDGRGEAAAESAVLGEAFGLDRAFWGLTRRKEVWAICVTQYCQSWGMYALFNWLPSFFNEQVRSF